ncbi:transposon Ty3-I Gag-Pol polyprotein [Trichonephila clavipes]|nr:transposon Ty3-I Gag-Pol polyprotein [Trichonephila clavipes]
MIRWALKLSEFNIEWEHRPGVQNVVANVLSRNPIGNMDGSQISCAAFRALALSSREQLIREQREDPELGHSYRYLENPEDGSVNATVCEGWSQDFKLIDGLLFYAKYSTTLGELRVYIPKSFREAIMQEFHDMPLAGRLGKKKTYLKLRDTCYFPYMRKYIFEYVSNCDRCQKFNYKNALPAGLLIPVVSNYPNEIVTDNGPQFISDVFEHLSHRLDIKRIKTVTYQPQANLMERVNRTLVQMIACFVEENHDNWDRFLDEFSFALRTAVNETTGPYRVLEVRNNNLTIWKKGKRVTVNIDQVRVYHPRHSDANSFDSTNETLYEGKGSSNGSSWSHPGKSRRSRKPSGDESKSRKSNKGTVGLEDLRLKRKNVKSNETAERNDRKRSKICRKRSLQGSEHRDPKRQAHVLPQG